MALSLTQDVTQEFNQDGFYIADASNWDLLVWQFVNPSGTIEIFATNDSGAIQGVTDGFALTSTNYTKVQATYLGDGTSTTSVSAAGLYRTTHVGQFVRVGAGDGVADKVIVQYHKFS